MIDGRTRVVCLLGDPVEHSLSPAIHNACFKKMGLNYVYVAFRVEREALRKAIEGMKALNIVGANVTMPHKTEALNYLDEVSEDAMRIGAVNTIVNRNGVLIGFNTDGVGALKSVERFTSIDGARIIVLGTGGAARSIISSLLEKASKIVVLGRRVEKAVELANRFGGKVSGKSIKELDDELRRANMLVNATPVGMEPNIEESLVPRRLLRRDLIVFDVVYKPVKTKLLRDAEDAGCLTIDGLWMLVYQAAESFKIWTGRKPSVEYMREVALKELSKANV